MNWDPVQGAVRSSRTGQWLVITWCTSDAYVTSQVCCLIKSSLSLTPEAEFLEEIQTKIFRVFPSCCSQSRLQLCLEISISSNSRNHKHSFQSSAHRIHIFLEMKQGQCVCPLSWIVHCNFTSDGKCNKRWWASPPPSPARANFTLMTECTPESSGCNSVYSVVQLL